MYKYIYIHTYVHQKEKYTQEITRRKYAEILTVIASWSWFYGCYFSLLLGTFPYFTNLIQGLYNTLIIREKNNKNKTKHVSDWKDS